MRTKPKPPDAYQASIAKLDSLTLTDSHDILRHAYARATMFSHSDPQQMQAVQDRISQFLNDFRNAESIPDGRILESLRELATYTRWHLV